MKVLHVPYGSPMIDLCKAQRMAGIDAVSCHLFSNAFNFIPDLSLSLNPRTSDFREKIGRVMEVWIKEFDIFHFHFGETLLPDKSDLEALKNAGKKLIVQHHGSEVRMIGEARKLNPYVRTKPDWTEEKIKRNLTTLSAYIDHAIVKDHELAGYIKPYYKYIHIVEPPVDTAVFPFIVPLPKKKPVIAHAPTMRDLKGTEDILKAVEQLQREGEIFEFRLLEKTAHQQALASLSQADLVIDQLLIGEIGMVTLEALACGKPVICYIRPDLLQHHPASLPVISANPDTIYSVLKDALKAKDTWPDIGRRGRAYIEEHHDPLEIGEYFRKLYESL